CTPSGFVPSKCFQNPFHPLRHRGVGPAKGIHHWISAPSAFRIDNRLQPFARQIHIVVDENVIVAAKILDFPGRSRQPSQNHLLGVFRAGPQTLGQFFPGRGQDKDTDGFGYLLLQLSRTLNVDVENHVLALGLAALQDAAMRSIVIPKDQRPFEEFAAADSLFEVLPRDEDVVLAVDLRPARRAGRIGGREDQVPIVRQQALHQRGLTRARVRRDDENAAHSRFKACSRMRSILVLISRPSAVIRTPGSPAPDVFERVVFVSRFISCNRKSSFLPSSPPWSSSCSSSRTWTFSRSTSSLTSLRSTKYATSWARRCGSSGMPLNSFEMRSCRRIRIASVTAPRSSQMIWAYWRISSLWPRMAATVSWPSRSRNRFSASSASSVARTASAAVSSGSGAASSWESIPGIRKARLGSGSARTPLRSEASFNARR